MKIRKMTEADVSAVAAFEREIFSPAWSERSIAGALNARGAICLAAEEDGELAGYLLGMQILDEAEVQRIAASPEKRRRGIGRALMEEFLREASENGVLAETLEVRAGNVPALKLYASFSFREEGRRKNYYSDPTEDALILWRRQESGR